MSRIIGFRNERVSVQTSFLKMSWLFCGMEIPRLGKSRRESNFSDQFLVEKRILKSPFRSHVRGVYGSSSAIGRPIESSLSFQGSASKISIIKTYDRGQTAYYISKWHSSFQRRCGDCWWLTVQIWIPGNKIANLKHTIFELLTQLVH